jgi:MFS transporter, FHS family, glucose/mannose:H+ symporter
MYKKNLVFAASCIGMLLFGIVLISLGSLLPSLIKKFSLDELGAGSLATLLPFGILAGSLIFGPLVDRYGYKALLIICSALILIGLEGIAFAEEFFVLQISIFLIGFGGGVINGGTNALVADISTEGKGANLSLLGVFFGLGALGMPVVLGFMSKYFSYENILIVIGFAVLIPIIFFTLIKFPEPKLTQGLPIKSGISLLKKPVLLLFGLALFFQSGMEGLVNNWTTTFIITKIGASEENALFALSWFVVGITVTRIVLGGLLKKVSSEIVLFSCLGISLAGAIVLYFAAGYPAAITALILLGIGFSAGFPVILGLVAETYASLSGTAFSIVLVIALIGNMLLNYLMGLTAHAYGIEHLPILIITAIVFMIISLTAVLKKVKQ